MLTFASAAQVTFLASWDAWSNGIPHIELHGTEASMRLPDPNWFGGDVLLSRAGADWEVISSEAATFGRRNYDTHLGPVANYRGLGLAEMARAIAEGREHRASGELALHLLAVMTAILEAAQYQRAIAIVDSCDRPIALGEAETIALCNAT